MKAFEVLKLTKHYGSVKAVDEVSFQVEPGEVFGYLGPNGSGKTTTLRCLMGLLRPTQGDCFVLGERVMAGRGTQRRRIGYLPGDFSIWTGRTARQSLKVLAALGGGQDIDIRRADLADRLDLDLDRRVGNLSKGNRQKVGILYAFQHQPDLLILDEPTSGLDPLVRQAVLDLIREAAHAGATVLLSSHDLSEVAAVCERTAILREGRLIELAPIAQIVHQGQRRLRVWFSEGEEVPDINTLPKTGLHIIERKPTMLHLAYQGPVDPVLKWLAQFSVDRIDTPQTSLEEAFIQYYKGTDHEA